MFWRHGFERCLEISDLQLDFAGEGGQYQSGEKAKKDRLIRLRRQIAWALAEIDQPAGVSVLISILGDVEPSVRSAAAFGLAGMDTPEAAAGLAEAMAVDYGTIGEASRNPVVQAHIARAAQKRFAGDEETARVTEAGFASPYASVRFLVLCQSMSAEPEVESES